MRLAVSVDPELDTGESRGPATGTTSGTLDGAHTEQSPTAHRAAGPSRRARSGHAGPPSDMSTKRQVQEWRASADHRHPGQPAEPALLLRDLRDRVLQPVRPRRGGRGGRGARQGLQPAAGVRRLRTRQDPPAARDRPLRPQPVDRRQDPLRLLRGVHQRRDQRDQGRQHRRAAAPLPRRRRAPGRRHPVPRGQAADPGGVLPHLQHAAQRQQADRDQLRPAAQAARPSSRTGCATGSSGACSPTYSRPTWRPASRSCARRPPPTGSPRRPTCWSSSPRGSRPTSASSRVR